MEKNKVSWDKVACNCDYYHSYADLIWLIFDFMDSLEIFKLLWPPSILHYVEHYYVGLNYISVLAKNFIIGKGVPEVTYFVSSAPLNPR